MRYKPLQSSDILWAPSTGGESPLTVRYGRWAVNLQPLGPSTGGESPLTVRYGRRAINLQPLGPSTVNAQRVGISKNTPSVSSCRADLRRLK